MRQAPCLKSVKVVLTHSESGTYDSARGDRLKDLMKAKRWTRDGLAEKTGISQGKITQYRKGVDIPTAHALAIAAVMGIEISELISAVYGVSATDELNRLLIMLPAELKQNYIALIKETLLYIPPKN